MAEYRVDTTPAAAQRPVIYLHGVASVVANADVIFFLDYQGNVKATVPVSSNVAYVAL